MPTKAVESVIEFLKHENKHCSRPAVVVTNGESTTPSGTSVG